MKPIGSRSEAVPKPTGRTLAPLRSRAVAGPGQPREVAVRRHTIAIAGGVAAILVTTTAVSASPAGTGAPGGWKSHVIRVERVGGPTVPVDVDNSGGSTIGDEFVTGAEFFMGSRRVGDDGVVCTKVRAPETYQCLATNSFAKGDLTVQFLADFTRPARATSRSRAAPAPTEAPPAG